MKNESDTTTANLPSVPMPMQGFKQFDVDTSVFRRFQLGRNKFERWSKFLDIEDEFQQEIFKSIKSSKEPVILRDSTTGAMISVRKRSSNGL